MSTTRILDIDTSESEKLRMLPTEKVGAFSAVFWIFANPLLLCASVVVLVVDLRASHIYEERIIADGLLVFTCLVAFFGTLPMIYLVRSVAQLDRKRFHRTRWLLMVVAALAFGVPLVNAMKDARASPIKARLLFFGISAHCFMISGSFTRATGGACSNYCSRRRFPPLRWAYRACWGSGTNGEHLMRRIAAF